MIDIKCKSRFDITTRYLEKIKRGASDRILDKYGKLGVEALSAATPVDTGLTAKSWYYKVQRSRSSASITFYNSNIQNGIPIAIIIQTGHGTRNGGWVQGRDYINPALRTVFDKFANEAWREVTTL